MSPPTPSHSSTQEAKVSLIAKKFSLTAVAAVCAESATFPIDIGKTRLQLQGGSGYKGTNLTFFGVLRSIVRQEGVKGLYAGVTPAIARHIPYTGFRTIGYEYIRRLFCGDDVANAPMWARAASGISAGGIAQTLAVPCDVVKVRMMADGRLVAAGEISQPRYTGLMHAFRTIYAKEGLRGMYVGCMPAIQRAALVNLGELTTYDTAKGYFVTIFGDTLSCHVSSAVCSGFFASLCSTPADVAKSRIMNQVQNPDGSWPYRGTLDCWAKTVKQEGFLSLYKGFFPGWLRLGPWQLVFWCSYERLRIWSGV
eukprot:CAMPEP_0206536328 /NCGR_PEP_ID=MMETSP0325_2-20121206/6686_1 /ASSEMBLY_ACC=CAM_ASM_000347 /TAXON_ID=2866 /ORGANISM="Crypthecodinium cohnii, Strain Seligo" /LENGTH=309 /DNA_ID=CAMNT_0054033523 /DNA_START=128 /DNA_END=1053 /DNA_ORIENTATION=+